MSKGQKATAILPLLLRPAPYPLILDQPEDDLDNRFIFETLVEKLKELKSERQLIFVTHNANIPVIGDADRVLAMSMSSPEQAELIGAGSVEEMREPIIELLEGGRSAFEFRSRTYGLPDD
jgi:ABC-type sulfate/molybdate transport systems ATPase subunit